jgi:dTDP-4-dehydrorhamnose reductase
MGAIAYLIVGASGFIGAHVLYHVRSLGHEVVGTQSASRKPGLVTFDLRTQRMEDCVDGGFLESGESRFGVICAGINQVDRCYREREVSYQINVAHTIRLIEDMQRFDIKPVFLSTGWVFDGSSDRYDEQSKPCPINEYGRHKVEVEGFIRDHAPGALIVRLDKVVGDEPSERHLLSEWYRSIRQRAQIACVDGQMFSPTLVDDVARAIISGCQRDLAGIYHVANSEFISRAGLARQFAETMGEEAVIESRPESEFGFLEPRPARVRLDSTKFVKETGIGFSPVRDVLKSFHRKARRDG